MTVSKHQRKPKKSKRIAATMSVEEAARLLNIGRNQAYAGCAAGQIPCMRVGKRWLVITAALERKLEQAVKEAAA